MSNIFIEATLAHEGKEYIVHVPSPWYRQEKYGDVLFSDYIYHIESMWEDGNYSCDCNRLDFISYQYNDVPQEDNRSCGDTVDLINLKICGISDDEAELINQEVKTYIDEASAALWKGDLYGHNWRVARIKDILEFPMTREVQHGSETGI